MPSSWLIEFEGVSGRDVRTSGLHRFLSAWFGEDPEQHTDRKGYSLGERGDRDGAVAVVVRCVSDRLGALLSELPRGQAVTFGHTFPKQARVRDCVQVAEATWDDLAVPLGTAVWQIEFLSPVSLRRHGVDQPWPAPAPLLAGVAEKWAAYAPIPLPWADEDAHAILVTGVELTMEQSQDAPVPTWGAVGRVEWTWDLADRRAPADGPARVERLLRLAEFTGLGAYPQHGLGRVRVSGRRPEPRQRAPRR